MSHDVEIDQVRLDAVFTAYQSAPEGAATLPPGQQCLGPEEQQESAWLATCVFAFSWLNAYAPNWGVPDEKIEELAEKAAAMLDQFFPFGPGDPDKLPPWAQFLACLGGIVVMYGFDFQTMTLKPLTEQPPETEPEGTDTGEATSAPAQQPGKFSTMGSPDDE